MLLKFFMYIALFVAIGASWCAILWFGIRPDFNLWPSQWLVYAHVMPPVIFSVLLLSLSRWSKIAKLEAEAPENAGNVERQAAFVETQYEREDAMRKRRFACDCRIVAIGNLVVNDQLELAAATKKVRFQTTTADEAKAAHASDNLLEGLETAVTDALRHVYVTCAAAAVLPLYVVAPSGTAIAEVDAKIRAIHHRVVADLALPIVLKSDVPTIHALPPGKTAANAVIDLFEATPNLPGAVILAFDSPLLTRFADQDPERQGKPSHGAFALLMTHAELPAFLKTIPEVPNASMSREWRGFADKQAPEQLALLQALPTPLAQSLSSLPVLARVHKTASAQYTEPKLTLLAQTLIEQGQINAGMADLPQMDGEADAPLADNPAPACAWLVHNAGTADYAGPNLSAVMTALSYVGIDIHPLKSATNSVLQIGDLGSATSLGMLALTLAQAATQKAPAMSAEFSQSDGLTVGFVVPATAAEVRCLQSHAAS